MSKAPLRRGLVDTGLLLDIASGDNAATQFAHELLATALIAFSELSAMVVVAGCQDAAELALVQRLLRSNTKHPVTAPISRRALRLLEAIPPPSPLTADDAIIAAMALVHKLPLYTLNTARFAVVPRLTAIQPY